MTTEVALEYGLLGPLEIRRDGEIVRLGSEKQRALLAVLLLARGEVVSTDRLADALWGEQPPTKARHTLQVYVSQLRKALAAEAIETQANGYRIRLEAGQLDADRFADSLAAAVALANERPAEATRRVEEAMALWRGPALADFPYEAFATQEISRLEELRLTAIETRIDAKLAYGSHHELVAELQELVAEHPLRERLRAALMIGLYRAGRQAEALQVYQETRERLRDELGIDPSPELQRLHLQILNQDDSLNAPSLGEPAARKGVVSLPAPATTLVGREIEQAELTRLLVESGARLVCVTGTGGIGKTRLVTETAHAVTSHFRGGVWFVDLSAVRDPELVIPTLSLAIGASGLPADFIGEDHVLLVLDNFEQVVAGAVAVAELVAACPNLAVLVTSRERLRLKDEVEYVLEPLPDGEAVNLFRARAVMLGREGAAASEQQILELCRCLDRLPLAIELAAARMKLFGAEELLARLERRLSVLTVGSRDAPARHQTLRATIEWSYELLDDRQAAFFRRLAVFAGSFSREDAEEVCDASLETLAELLDKSLITLGSDVQRLTLLATVREFALERLVESDEADQFRRRHAEHIYAQMESLDKDLDLSGQPDLLKQISWRHDDVRAALAWAISRFDSDLAHRLVSVVGWFWYVQNHLEEGRRWIDATLALPSCDDLSLRALVLLRGGAIADLQGDLDAAESLVSEALDLRRSIGDTYGVCAALNNLGNVALHRGDLWQARVRYEESLALGRELDDALSIASPLSNLASIDLAEGHPEQALALLEESLVLAERIDNEYGVAYVRGAIGAVMIDLGRYNDAAAFLLESIRMKRELDHREGIAQVVEEIAALALVTDDAVAAAGLLGASEALRSSVGAGRSYEQAERVTRTEKAARTQIGDDAYERAWIQGKANEPEETIALGERAALAYATSAQPVTPSSSARS